MVPAAFCGLWTIPPSSSGGNCGFGRKQVGSDLLQLEWISAGNEIVFASHGFGA